MRRGKRISKRWEDIESPCVNVCKLKNGACVACGRTQDEIRDWVIMTDKQRSKIMERLDGEAKHKI